MALTDFRSLPSNQDGIIVVPNNSTWTFGSWTELTPSTSGDISVMYLQFQTTNITALDTTVEYLFDIGTGGVGAETTIIQIPFSVRNDTQVGYYSNKTYSFFLPEPKVITDGSRISIRGASSIASAGNQAAFKLFYIGNQQAALVSGGFDPMGTMGFFGM